MDSVYPSATPAGFSSVRRFRGTRPHTEPNQISFICHPKTALCTPALLSLQSFDTSDFCFPLVHRGGITSRRFDDGTWSFYFQKNLAKMSGELKKRIRLVFISNFKKVGLLEGPQKSQELPELHFP